jgi:hypothetical protein
VFRSGAIFEHPEARARFRTQVLEGKNAQLE